VRIIVTAKSAVFLGSVWGVSTVQLFFWEAKLNSRCRFSEFHFRLSAGYSPAKGTDDALAFFLPCRLKMQVPLLLRYGKYCGVRLPRRDALDACCCMVHDHCVDTNNSEPAPAGPTFPGNGCDVGQTAGVRHARGHRVGSVLAGKILHRRHDGQ
jgi:hypothetical protein